MAIQRRSGEAAPDGSYRWSLLSDLHSVEKQVTAAGNVRYAAPRSEGSHADRFMALALALHAAAQAGVGWSLGAWKKLRPAPRRRHAVW